MANVPSLTLCSWVDQWFNLVADLKPKTVATYKSLLKNHLLPRFGDTSIGAITPLMVRAWVADLQRAAMSTSRVRQCYRLLSTILRTAVECDLLDRSPCRGVRLPRMPKNEQRFLSAEEILRIAEAVPSDYHALVLVLGFTGVRWGEACALRRSSCDLDRGRLSVDRSLVDIDGHLSFGGTKTGRSREVVVAPFLVEELRRHLLDVPGDENALVFTSQEGTPLRNCNFRTRVWLRALQQAGIEGHVRIHDLRHTAASLMIASGANIKAIQCQLGHATATLTLDRYGHLVESTQDELSANVEAIHARTIAAS